MILESESTLMQDGSIATDNKTLERTQGSPLNLLLCIEGDEIMENQIQVGGEMFTWAMWSPFQGVSYVFLRLVSWKKGCYDEQEDILVAEKQRHQEVTVHNEELLKKCPFQYFTDGFNFTHPTEGVKYSNHGATKIRL